MNVCGEADSAEAGFMLPSTGALVAEALGSLIFGLVDQSSATLLVENLLGEWSSPQPRNKRETLATPSQNVQS